MTGFETGVVTWNGTRTLNQPHPRSRQRIKYPLQCKTDGVFSGRRLEYVSFTVSTAPAGSRWSPGLLPGGYSRRRHHISPGMEGSAPYQAVQRLHRHQRHEAHALLVSNARHFRMYLRASITRSTSAADYMNSLQVRAERQQTRI